jgi:glycosyltransferase involved in cell wall biosynthesis
VVLVHAGGLILDLECKRLGLMPTLGTGELTAVAVSRRFGPLKSAWFFQRRFAPWLARILSGNAPFDVAYIIHLKAAAMLKSGRLPYVYEAHEIFAETPPAGSTKEAELHALERQVLADACGRVATSKALGDALNTRYFHGHDASSKAKPSDGNGTTIGALSFAIIPHGGGDPLPESTAVSTGPYVYAGSLGDWKGLDIAMEALLAIESQDVTSGPPELRIVGGSQTEWDKLCEIVLDRLPANKRQSALQRLHWQPRVASADLPRYLAGARAGLIPTLPETGTGRYSCPMKLYDYARCGLPVVTTALPSLDSLSLDTEVSTDASWCMRVKEPTMQAWRQALIQQSARTISPDVTSTILEWAKRNTWTERGRRLLNVLQIHNRSRANESEA